MTPTPPLPSAAALSAATWEELTEWAALAAQEQQLRQAELDAAREAWERACRAVEQHEERMARQRADASAPVPEPDTEPAPGPAAEPVRSAPSALSELALGILTGPGPARPTRTTSPGDTA
ncbi:hypothetical protein ACFYVL_21475 [Streptomyces sp. NPDC004111]|uniref:hypothetical protein n=1 Tax=Streptomyces sp. NPDC004111 TaxID=3364690 RepID=UPI0036A39C2E